MPKYHCRGSVYFTVTFEVPFEYDDIIADNVYDAKRDAYEYAKDEGWNSYEDYDLDETDIQFSFCEVIEGEGEEKLPRCTATPDMLGGV